MNPKEIGGGLRKMRDKAVLTAATKTPLSQYFPRTYTCSRFHRRLTRL